VPKPVFIAIIVNSPFLPHFYDGTIYHICNFLPFVYDEIELFFAIRPQHKK